MTLHGVGSGPAFSGSQQRDPSASLEPPSRAHRLQARLERHLGTRDALRLLHPTRCGLEPMARPPLLPLPLLAVAVAVALPPPVHGTTLAFVFDVTGSMWDDLMQVIDGASGILERSLRGGGRTISNYALVPFHDPGSAPKFPLVRPWRARWCALAWHRLALLRPGLGD